MAAIPVTIVGINEAGNPTTIVGMMSYTGLGVGGGPIGPEHPAHPIAPGGPPPSIWPSPGHPAHPIAPGGEPPHPAHPIELPPVNPGEPPVSIWPGRPEHPIVLPPEPEPPQPPQTVTVLKAPPPGGGWGAVSEYGWAYYPAQGEPQPKG